MQPRSVPSSPSSARPEAVRTIGTSATCPWQNVRTMLRKVGLRPTRQRMELGWILFSKGDRHLTAEMLFYEAS